MQDYTTTIWIQNIILIPLLLGCLVFIAYSLLRKDDN